MPRPKSSNPVRNISVGLPATTHAKIERFNPRNRSKFFNRAVLEWMRQHDPETKQRELDAFEASRDPFESVKELTTQQLANILHARLRNIPEGHPSHRKQLTKNLETFVKDRKWVE
jgi:hypothetical protein